MKKKVLIGIAVVLVIVAVVLVAMVFFKPGEEKLAGGAIGPTPSPERIAQIRAQEKILPLPEGPLEDVKRIGDGGIEVDYIYDVTDTGTIGNLADFIIIGTVQNIEGVTNYNPTTEKYTSARTVGTIKIEKILKGEIKEETIPFIKAGAYIPFSEYKKVLNGNLTFEDMPKDDDYILQLGSDDILIEQGKTYYMLLEYDTDFERYEIVFNKYGVREIDTSTGLNLKDNSKIKVKDNKTGSTTPLSSILSQIQKVAAEEEKKDSNESTESQAVDAASLYVMPKEKEEKGIIEQIKDFITPIILIIYSINTVISVLV